MSPYEQLAAVYAAHPQEESFENYVAWYAKIGFVFATPDFFAMGRPVIRAAREESIKDPTHLFATEDCDCWFIHGAAGNLPKMWRILPWPLEWMCWERVVDPLLELRFVRVETLKRLCPPDLQLTSRP